MAAKERSLQHEKEGAGKKRRAATQRDIVVTVSPRDAARYGVKAGVRTFTSFNDARAYIQGLDTEASKRPGYTSPKFILNPHQNWSQMRLRPLTASPSPDFATVTYPKEYFG